MIIRNIQILYIIFVIGIILRIYYSFIIPVYNTDEIAIGLDIKNRLLIDIFKPMKDYQSAPPLYVFIQKCIFLFPFKAILKGKLLSFFISSGILFLSLDYAKQTLKKESSRIIFLIFFSFSPFVLYNTLTFKQYGIDLFFLLLVFRFFDDLTNNTIKGGIIFSIWCLVSNVGLFFSSGLILLRFVKFFRNKGLNFSVLDFIKVNWIYSIGGICYVFYYIWFLQQPGGEETKIYMQKYWENTFIPLDFSFFRYLASFVHGLSIYFFSTYRFVGYPLFVFYLFILWSLRSSILKSDRALFLVFGFCTHVLLNIFHLYPLSDRLYLYLAIFMILPISVYLDKKEVFLKRSLFVLIYLVFISWTQYTPFGENDVLKLTKNLDKYKKESIFFTYLANHDFSRWCKFTDMVNSRNIKKLDKDNYTTVLKDDVIVSRVYHFYGHEERTSTEEKSILVLQNENKIKLVEQVDGYNIYKAISNFNNSSLNTTSF